MPARSGSPPKSWRPMSSAATPRCPSTGTRWSAAGGCGGSNRRLPGSTIASCRPWSNRTSRSPAPRACWPTRWPNMPWRWSTGLMRSLPVFFRAQQKREFIRRPTRDLHHATVGIVGFGGVGRRIAEVVRPFKTRILAIDMFPVEKPEWVEALWPAERLDDLLAEVDFLFLAVPLTPLTRGMLDASKLAKMRGGATLINVARGPLVVERDLVEALRSGHLAGAGLDVTEVEPLSRHEPLVGSGKRDHHAARRRSEPLADRPDDRFLLPEPAPLSARRAAVEPGRQALGLSRAPAVGRAIALAAAHPSSECESSYHALECERVNKVSGKCAAPSGNFQPHERII